jgi:hypothetical protein
MAVYLLSIYPSQNLLLSPRKCKSTGYPSAPNLSPSGNTKFTGYLSVLDVTTAITSRNTSLPANSLLVGGLPADGLLVNGLPADNLLADRLLAKCLLADKSMAINLPVGNFLAESSTS